MHLDQTLKSYSIPRISLPLILGLFLTIASFSKVKLEGITVIGYGVLALLICYAVLHLKNISIPLLMSGPLAKFLRIAALFAMIYVAAILWGPIKEGVVIATLLISALLFFIFISQKTWHQSSLWSLITGIWAIVPINAFFWIVSGAAIASTDTYVSSNIVGAYAYLMIYLLAYANVSATPAQSVICKIYAGICALTLIVTETRSLWIASTMALLTYFLWPILCRNRRIFNAYFWIAVTIVLAFVYIYPQMKDIPGIDDASAAVAASSGKNLFSGRDRLWAILEDAVFERPILGYGAGAQGETFIEQSNDTDVSDSETSASDIYIQIALQVGLIGLAIFFSMIFCLWNLSWFRSSTMECRILGAFLIGMLFHQTFEISLTQNQFVLGLLQWLIMGIGISRSVVNKDTKMNVMRTSAPDLAGYALGTSAK